MVFWSGSSVDQNGGAVLQQGATSKIYLMSNNKKQFFCHPSPYLYSSVMRVGSDTFGDPIFQKGLQN